MGKKEDTKTCEGCPAKCCRYVALEFDIPEDKEDFHHIRWFLMHANVRIQIDDEDNWYIEFRTPCKNLDENNLCVIHPMHPSNPNGSPEKYGEPQICIEHSPAECEFNGEGEDPYEHVFTNVHQFEEYMEKNMADVITKEPEADKNDPESEEDDAPLLKLDESKIDELIVKLKKLKDDKEFSFKDSDGDDYEFELS